MILTKFNFLTLIFSALLTFNINAGTCTPLEDDELDEQISQQESGSFTEDSVPTESEYVASVDENISEVSIETSTFLEDGVLEAAELITLEEAALALGVIGIVALAGFVSYNVLKIWLNPYATTDQKVESTIAQIPFVGMVAAFYYEKYKYSKKQEKVYVTLINTSNESHYAINNLEVTDLKAYVLKIEEWLTKAINGTTITAILENVNKKLLRDYAKQYLSSVKKIGDSLPRIYAKQWMKASPDFIKLDVALKKATAGEENTLPSIISSQTLTLCGINDTTNFLNFTNKSSNQIKRCLGGIFYDYRAHFNAYSLDDTITISVPDRKHKQASYSSYKEVVKNVTFRDLLTSYAKTYNHFLSNTKISYANSIYQNKAKVERMVCLKQKTDGENFLLKARAGALNLAKKRFEKKNNVNKYGQSLNNVCWQQFNQSPDSHYYCKAYLKYDSLKDTSIAPALAKINALQVVIENAYNNCLEGGTINTDTDPHKEFIYALNHDRFYPMLDEDNVAKLFVNVFRGIKSNLMLSVAGYSKIFYENKKQK